jgi:hypothetical protein
MTKKKSAVAVNAKKGPTQTPAQSRKSKDDKFFADLDVSNAANYKTKKQLKDAADAAAASLEVLPAVQDAPVAAVEPALVINDVVVIPELNQVVAEVFEAPNEVVIVEVVKQAKEMLSEALIDKIVELVAEELVTPVSEIPVTITIEQGDPLVVAETPTVTPAAVEVPVTLAEIKPKKAGGKAVDPTSGRQAILRVIFENGNEPMAPAAINAKLKEQGREIKYISSHLNYFKTHGQIEHVEGTSTYRLTQKTLPRFQAEADIKAATLTIA